MKKLLARLLLSTSFLLPLPAPAQVPGGGGVVVGAPITGSCTTGYVVYSNSGVVGCEAASGTGTVTSVAFTGGLISVASPTTAAALTVAGTSGGIPYFSSTSTWASSALLVANALMIGGGAATAPSTTTTGANVLTALGVAVGSAGAFVTNGGALGTPSSGVATNITGLVYTALPALSANQVLGALTATTPSGLSVPSCSAATSALTWTSGTGFGCNTISAGVASVGNASVDTSLTIAGTGSGPWTGAVTVKLNLSNAQTWSNQTFVAPVLGAATGTSLALGGATIATNGVMAMDYSPGANTSTPAISVINLNAATSGNQQQACILLTGQGWKTTATAASEEVDIQFCTVPVQSAATPLVGWAIYGQTNGGGYTSLLDYNVTATGGTLSAANNFIAPGNISAKANAGTFQLGSSNDVIISRHATAWLQHGGADQANPTAQTVGFQNVAAGNANNAGVNATINGSLSNGSGASGDIIFQTGGTGAASGSQNSEVAALTIKGATQVVQINQISTDSSQTDNTVCEDDTTHGLYSGSGTAGICKGTSSSRFKHDITGLSAGLPEIMGLRPVRYFYNPGYGDSTHPLYGFIAEDAINVAPELVGRDSMGLPNSLDYLGVVPILVRAVQEQQAEINALNARIRAQ